VSSAHPVKILFSAQAVLAAVIASGSLTAGAQSKSDDPHAPSAIVDGVAAAVDPNKYRIGPEDILFIKVWREPDFTIPVAVRPDGKITMPLIGEIQAAEQTPLQLTQNVAGLLAKYINNPDVTVFVTEVRSKKYYIDGEVNRPGFFPLVTPTTVLEALSRSEGFKDFANEKKIRILRAGKIHFFNFKEVTNGKHLEQNIPVENGDHIIVP
jgi:polysaccharide export outer membrane protein